MNAMLATENQALLRLRGADALPLKSVKLSGRIIGRFARLDLTQIFAPSPSGISLEAIYTFPLPTDATVLDVSVTVHDRAIEGRVEEREAAHRAYTEAVDRGQRAALLEEERPEVFNLSLGNLDTQHPTTVHLTLLVPLEPADGSMRWRIPTVVAPRYMGHGEAGDRTMGGRSAPTPSVPDADRLSPPLLDHPGYELAFDLVVPDRPGLTVTSPSHDISCRRDRQGIHILFRDALEPLDRDLVLELTGVAGEGLAWLDTEVIAGQGTFTALVVPDLSGVLDAPRQPLEVVFLLDRSGSMGGQPIEEARRALQLSLRQLREGDRFSVIAFDHVLDMLAPEPLVFSPTTLAQADTWISQIEARGGTDLDVALREALRLAPAGVQVLLTDAQFGNEGGLLQILEHHRRVGGRNREARIHAFGIGHNVVSGLLTRMARLTGGDAVDIVPGENIDERVVTQFASLMAPRLQDPVIRFEGVEIEDLVPSRIAAIVDGQPLSLTGRFKASKGKAQAQGPVRMIVMGRGPSGPVHVELELDREDRSEAKGLDRLWARQVVAEGLELELRDADRGRGDGGVQVSGGTGCGMFDEGPSYRLRARLTQLALQYQVLTPLTSWVFVDPEAPDSFDPTRQVTVHVPVARFSDAMKADHQIPDVVRAFSAPPIALSALEPMMQAFQANDDDFGSTLYAAMPDERLFTSSRPGAGLQQTLMSQQADGLWADWKDTIQALAVLLEAKHRGDMMVAGAVSKAFDAVIRRLVGPDSLGTTEQLALFAVMLSNSSGRQARAIAMAAKTCLGVDDLRELAMRAAAELDVDIDRLRSPADIASVFLAGVVDRLERMGE